MSRTKNLMMLAVVVTIFMSQWGVTHSICNKVRVHVINGFNTTEPLQAHCKSKDDDLGLHHIPVHEEFSWTFRTDFFSRTRFTCHMWWSLGQQTLDVFWVNDKFIENECGGTDCRWLAKNDGIYLYSFEHKLYRLKYKWN